MTEPCRLFDRYRDGELDSFERAVFEAHLDACEDCRGFVKLLDNLAYTIRKMDAPLRFGFAERTAAAALRQTKSWDAVVISWLRPQGLWLAWALLLFLCCSVLLLTGSRYHDIHRGYEVLLTGSDNGGLGRDVAQIHNDEDLLRWLQQEGNNR
jgi:predicted anti-sigma-YlaC factor YlaD